jgi:uncharacterized membrane protein
MDTGAVKSSSSVIADQPRIPPSLPVLFRPTEWLSQTNLPWLFLLFAVPSVLFLSIAMPPFQVADELAHALRANQIATGKIVADRLGGWVQRDLVKFGELYKPMWFHSEVKQTSELASRAAAIKWSGEAQEENFQNTAQYGPILYLPQAMGFLLGRLADFSLAQTLLVMRLVNAICACAVGFFALRVCRRANALMFATLVLPMTLSQFASASQDALLISLSLLSVAIASRILSEGRTARFGEFALFAAVVTATTLARPSQLALVLLSPAFFNWREHRPWAKIAVAIVAVTIIASWMGLLRYLMPPVPSDWSVSGQLEYILANPLALPSAVVKTVVTYGWFLLTSLIGRLGWLDAPMPDWFIILSCVSLASALIAPGNRGSAWVPGLIGLTTFGAIVMATGFALYLSWTPVAKPTIDGVQGRYILGVLPLLGWAIPSYGARLEKMLMPAWVLVLAFPIVTIATLPAVVMERYYGSWQNMAGTVKVLLLP